MNFAGGHAGILFLALISGCRSAPPPATAVETKVRLGNGTIHVASTLATAENCGMTRYVQPVYPKEAKNKHIEGVVKFHVLITKAGEVREIRLESGDPVLVPAAWNAVRQWRYAVCRVNGDPVDLRTTLQVAFTLSQ